LKTFGKTVFTATLLTMSTSSTPSTAANFGDDVAFLQKHAEVIVLTDDAGRAKLALVPAWQGRVVTSTADGEAGRSFGWINRELVASGKIDPHLNARGGEDRFWLGPEGGQFNIFFDQGKPFEFEHFHVPAAIDTMAYAVAGQTKSAAKFHAKFTVTNYSGTAFDLSVDRNIQLLKPEAAWAKLGMPQPKSCGLVAYESANKVTNVGKEAWEKKTGLLSIWILGMYNPSPATTIVVPINSGPESKLGSKVTSDYFGAVPAERLVVKDDVIYFCGDGVYRSKIGINPSRSKGVLGSYDAKSRVLTLVQFTQPAGARDYVNSLWKIQENPFNGDAANSYNDGPVTPGGKSLGGFYELESSSPALELAPGKSYEHMHRTMHITGAEAELEQIAHRVLDVSLTEIRSALPK
jgi:hypothetical protein